MITENGQAGKAEVFHYLDVCCRQVSKAYGSPDWDKWTNGDYISLSNILFKQTRVRISPNTLKRIFGKIKTDSRYYPQKATRDALALYTGYHDWDHFIQVQEWTERNATRPAELPAYAPPPALVAELPTSSQRPGPKRFWLIGAAMFLLVVLAFVWWQQHRETPEPIQFVCRNPLGENPHSAVFQVSPIRDPSAQYTIQFGDGKRENLNQDDSVYTHYYERPGRYFAILQRNDENIDTATVYLQTKGWTVTANMMHDTSRVYPIEAPDLFADKRRSVSALEAARAGVDTNRTFFMEFINSHPTGIDGDNFELRTQVKTSPDRAGVRCSQIGLTVWGESSQHTFDVMKPGCVHWINLQTSEVAKKSHRDDLSFLGADLRQGGTLTLRVVNKQASIFINGRKVYETHYKQPLARIYGVKIRFAGIGTINTFSLKDLKSGQVFDGNF